MNRRDYDYSQKQQRRTLHVHPISITQMEKTFSVFVFGDTFPNPTLVRLLSVKYRAVMYLDLIVGPPVSFTYGCLVCSARSSSHPIFRSLCRGRSAFPMAYQMQASQ